MNKDISLEQMSGDIAEGGSLYGGSDRDRILHLMREYTVKVTETSDYLAKKLAKRVGSAMVGSVIGFISAILVSKNPYPSTLFKRI